MTKRQLFCPSLQQLLQVTHLCPESYTRFNHIELTVSRKRIMTLLDTENTIITILKSSGASNFILKLSANSKRWAPNSLVCRHQVLLVNLHFLHSNQLTHTSCHLPNMPRQSPPWSFVTLFEIFSSAEFVRLIYFHLPKSLILLSCLTSSLSLSPTYPF